jgi:hypothetical protein
MKNSFLIDKSGVVVLFINKYYKQVILCDSVLFIAKNAVILRG